MGRAIGNAIGEVLVTPAGDEVDGFEDVHGEHVEATGEDDSDAVD
jgi:hypothetical protein